jgi:hypothetical protein
MRRTSPHFPTQSATAAWRRAMGALFAGVVALLVLLSVPVAVSAALTSASDAPASGTLSEPAGTPAAESAPSDAVSTEAPVPVSSEDTSMTLGSETAKSAPMEEALKPKPLLLSEDEMRSLLGTDPSFIYNTGDRPDPMLVPWTHVRVRSDEFRRMGEEATKNKDWAKAYESYLNAIHLLDSSHAPWAYTKPLMDLREKSDLELANLRNMLPPGMAFSLASAEAEARLPEWVKSNTSGIILSRKDPVCLVGPYTLHLGELVPGQDMPVYVHKIDRDTVTYRVKNKLFPVTLREGE